MNSINSHIVPSVMVIMHTMLQNILMKKVLIPVSVKHMQHLHQTALTSFRIVDPYEIEQLMSVMRHSLLVFQNTHLNVHFAVLQKNVTSKYHTAGKSSKMSFPQEHEELPQRI